MRNAPPVCVLACVLLGLLLLPPLASSALEPVAPDVAPGLQLPGLAGLERNFWDGDLYRSGDDAQRLVVADQMIGIMADVAAAGTRSDQAPMWRGRAEALWTRVDGSFGTSGPYPRSIPGSTPCVDVRTQSWSLLAAHALGQSTSSFATAAVARAQALRAIVSDLLSTASYEGRNACEANGGRLHATDEPLALFALASTSDSGGPPSSAASARLRSLATGLAGGAYSVGDETPVTENAQLLLALIASVEAGDADLVAARDAVGAWLRDDALVREGGLLVFRDVERGGGTQVDPAAQVWGLYSLVSLRIANQSLVNPAVPPEVATSYVDRFWSGDAGGFVGDDGRAGFMENALPAIWTRSVELRAGIPDLPDVGFVVLPLEGFTYPPPGDPEAAHLYLSNTWVGRFSLTTNNSGPLQVLLPVSQLGSFNASQPPSAFFPTPRLARSGAGRDDLTLVPVRSDPNLLRFDMDLDNGVNNLRFVGYAPVRPLASDFGSAITVRVEAFGAEPVRLETLQLELAAHDIEIQAVSLSDEPVLTFEVGNDITTQALPEPHMRVVLSGLTLPPGESEVVLSYNDVLPPSVTSLSVSRDLEGNDPITGTENLEILQGESAYARATVTDNAALSTVQLIFRVGEQKVDLRMEPVPGQADTFAVKLPTEGAPGIGSLQVVAVDAAATGNRNDSQPLAIEVKDPLFAGSVVMFVFSGTLFATSVIIWLKVRRKMRV